MPKIAIIQDGTELARQTYADIADCFDRCVEILSEDGPEFSLQTFTDEAVGFLLDRVDPEELDCLVFTSNAILSSQIERALQRRREHVHRYVAAGGGVVVLHQFRDSLSPILPDDVRPELFNRVTELGKGRAVAYDPEDVLLHYPVPIDMARLRDGRHAGPPSLYYKPLVFDALPQKLKPVLTTAKREVLLARTYGHTQERVVVAGMQLDWQADVPLLTNAIRYACYGQPQRLVWREDKGIQSELLLRWLGSDGNASIRPAPRAGAPVDQINRWLLSTVDLLVVPPDGVAAAEEREEVKRFLGNGGTLVTADRAPDLAASRVTGLVGRHTERALAARLHGELRAVAGWDTSEYAFELRNIIAALAFLWQDPPNRTDAAIDPRALPALRDEVRGKLLDPVHQQDLSSSIALAQILAFMTEPALLDPGLTAWMSGVPRADEFDVALQIRAVTAFGQRHADPGFLAAAADALESRLPGLSSPAPVIRVLDSVAMLDQVGLLQDEGGGARRLIGHACDQLDQLDAAPGVGWVSVEATADITRGLIALLDRLAADEAELVTRAADHIATGVTALRQASRRYERNRKGVAWLARLLHTVILADRRFPIGLQRLATLEWPERVTAGSGADRSLLDHLALENKTLRESERQLHEQRLAASLGRGATTVLTVLLVAGAFGATLARIGFDSAWTLIGNITLIVGLVAATVLGLFAGLDRLNLLARPAARLRDWYRSRRRAQGS